MIKGSNKSLGSLLKELREAKKMSLREMEEKCGISNAYISQVENGQIKRPSPNFLYKISEVLEYPYELLMERAGHVVPKPRAVPKSKISDEQRKAFAIFSTIKDLTEEEAEALIEFLNWRRSRQSKGSK